MYLAIGRKITYVAQCNLGVYNVKHIPTELPVDTDDLLELAEEQGWKIDRTGKNHYKLTSPEGQIVGHSGTPSDHRAILNFRAELKRKGLLPYVAPPMEPALPVEQEVESTPPETIVAETEIMVTKRQKADHGSMMTLITKILREHDKVEGLTTQEVYEYARVVVPKIQKKKVGQSLAYYATTKLVNKPSRLNWRLAEFGGSKTVGVVEDDDMGALEGALEALATLEKVIRKTIAQRKKMQELRDIMAKMG